MCQVSEDSTPPEPFPQEDYDRLSELLDLHSPLDLDGVLGLLHAIAVAPSVVPNETWLPKVLTGSHAFGDTALARYCIELLVRLKAEVQDAVDHEQTIVPDSNDIDKCASFASGYVAGAEADPSWVGDANRWTFASGIAYLADRLDLVPQHTIEQIEENLAPDPKQVIRAQMGSIVQAAAECFKELRACGVDKDVRVSSNGEIHRSDGLNAVEHGSPPTAPQQITRNEPCPCGSGRKFKRCCMS
jgi:uncharacterized protein YecA (UPF0149 family)